MDFLTSFFFYVVPFVIILGIVVFVHELGHYLVAIWNKVEVEAFSVGFGPEITGFVDKRGTRWKICALPLGGYVKMMGDADATSTTSDETTSQHPNSFPAKGVWQRFAIVLAGPLANFVFAILVLALLFSIVGRPFTPAIVGSVVEDGPAERAGIEVEDRIVVFDGTSIESFEDLQMAVRPTGGTEVEIEVDRNGDVLALLITPDKRELEDRFGNVSTVGVIGIARSGVEYKKSSAASSVVDAVSETARMITGTLAALGQMITGDRGTEELGGPLRIAQMSGQVAQDGFVPALWFTAILSINLGLINLFPIPMLDGGHLVMYLVEAFRGKPIPEQGQEYALRFGLAMVLCLMLFATWNDLVQLRVVDFFTNLVS